MNKRNIAVGLIFILLSVWIYFTLSTFEKEPGSFPVKIILREGIERSVKEVAEKLSADSGFDLEGAYKTGYTPADVADYLMNHPHTFPVSFHNGKYFEGRVTLMRIIPFSISIFLFITGAVILIVKGKKK